VFLSLQLGFCLIDVPIWTGVLFFSARLQTVEVFVQTNNFLLSSILGIATC
jgi:hypothetical protein